MGRLETETCQSAKWAGFSTTVLFSQSFSFMATAFSLLTEPYWSQMAHLGNNWHRDPLKPRNTIQRGDPNPNVQSHVAWLCCLWACRETEHPGGVHSRGNCSAHGNQGAEKLRQSNYQQPLQGQQPPPHPTPANPFFPMPLLKPLPAFIAHWEASLSTCPWGTFKTAHGYMKHVKLCVR